MDAHVMKCCDIHAGMLRRPVEFQRTGKQSDGAGGFFDAWGPIDGAPTRAKVVAASGSERFASGRVEAISRHRVTVRYAADLTERDAVVFGGKRYNIRFINNVEQRNRWMIIDVDGGVVGE
jgi:SPP1 family predicted phage head-tail adaptor